MGSRKRRKRLARAVDHFISVGNAVHTEQFHDVVWLQAQVKAAIRLARQVDAVLVVYEEDFTEDIRQAVQEGMAENADNQSACST